MAESRHARERVSTGVPGLDSILGGGLPKNRLYLVEGDPGTGKTTLALQFLIEGARRGEAGLYVALSETREELEDVARSHGWSLDGIAICDLTVPEHAHISEAEYTVFHPSEVELSETTESILAEVARVEPARVVFDSLSEMRLLARDPLRFRRQILALKQFFIGRECTVLLLDEQAVEGEKGQLESLAHGVVVLEQVAPEYGGKRRRLQVLKLRGVRFLTGYNDFKIETGGLRVFPRLAASAHTIVEKPRIVSSGVAELDRLLGGGIHAGTSTLIMGQAGTGKTTLGAQYAYAAAERGERAAYYTFDEGVSSLLLRCRALGIDLARHVRDGRVALRKIDPAELTAGEFADLVCTEIEGNGSQVVAIDSLNGYLTAMTDERFLVAHLHELSSFLNETGVASILMLNQHGLFGGNLAPPVDLSYLADTVLLLRHFEADGEVRSAISVLKKRTSDHERTIRELRLTPAGIRMGPQLRGFSGVLTGQPAFRGEGASLLGCIDGERGDE